MPKFKVNKTKNYTVMSNTHLKERKMSLKAKGLLSLMLSLPEKWDYSIKGLVSLSKDNETSVTSALKELKNMGYLRIKKLMPNETKTGRIEYIYDIYEEPFIQKQDPEILGLEKQGVEILGLEFLGLENQGQLNTNELSTKELNTNKLNTKDSPVSKQDIPYKEIIEYLNLKTGKHYRVSSDKTKSLIKARFNENYTLEDFKRVIDNKCKEWLKNEKMNVFLRPETLFGNKFEGYLNQNEIEDKTGNNIIEKFDKSGEIKELTEEEQQELDDLINEMSK
jgi:uncharacterized phage protein (TIGR02220 family)